MERRPQHDLKQWYLSSERKPLLIRGARQVGKSTLVRLFAKQMGLDLAEINLERTKLQILDETDIIVEKFLHEIEDKTGIEIGKKTLIFIDEIQAQPRALLYLRYLHEERADLAVIATGSLLEFYLTEEEYSVPVGRLQYYFLGPMDFEEFLLAKKELILLKRLKSYLEITESQHKRLTDVLIEYLYVGGMPAAVKAHVQGKGYVTVRKIQDDILNTYKDDFHKYAKKNESIQVQKIFQYIPFHLGQKIKYSDIDSDIRSYQLKQAFDLLVKARVCLKVPHTNATGLPLSTFEDERIFKTYFLDIGLCLAAQKLTWSQLLEHHNLLNQKGEIYEQFIAQHLFFRSHGHEEPKLNYWIKDKTTGKAEVDFLFDYGTMVFPVEVKSGKTGSLKSLWEFIKEKNCKVAIHFWGKKPEVKKEAYAFFDSRIEGVLFYHLPHYLVVRILEILNVK